MEMTAADRRYLSTKLRAQRARLTYASHMLKQPWAARMRAKYRRMRDDATFAVTALIERLMG